MSGSARHRSVQLAEFALSVGLMLTLAGSALTFGTAVTPFASDSLSLLAERGMQGTIRALAEKAAAQGLFAVYDAGMADPRIVDFARQA